MIEIDGSFGEGGGQILRTSLALSLITGEPFRITHIRAARKTPGLLRQHLTSVAAAAAVGEAQVDGAEPGSQELTFVPRTLRGGKYAFAIGTAGSTTLVLQTILVPLLIAPEPSIIELEGGTHNPAAPSFDFLTRSFLPLLGRMGAKVEATLERPGFYPAGGGRLVVSIEPARKLGALELVERGAIVGRRARAVVANLPYDIARREIAVVEQKTGWPPESLQAHTLTGSLGPGNVVTIELECEHVTEVVTGFGQRGVRAEDVAGRAVDELRRYLASNAAVGEHLADQLLLPMAAGAGGEFTTIKPSTHTTTNIETIRRFIDADVRIEPRGTRCHVEMRKCG
ncbi:MAG TPA: RNA 3'-terminal phosphate cyclase [Thermoanaerobaculia bacterium]|nr:RNA 3'-terminal phosphate cyclase [Thermoanaerobaculia bacterium]